MVSNLELNNADTTNYKDIDPHTLEPVQQDGPTNQDETWWINNEWAEQWTLFNSIPKLKSAIMMRAIWNVGRGYEADTRTMVELAHISGFGKQTFKQILYSMDVTRMIGGDAYAEIIRDEKTGMLLNLKQLSPGNVRIVRDKSGAIIRYELINNVKDKEPKKFNPEDIFHISYNLLVDQAHGVSVIKSLKKMILADDKLFDVTNKVANFQATPFIIFKLKTDDATKIANFKSKLKDIRTNTEDLVIPDDENLLSWQVVEVSPSSIILEWKAEITNEFYREIGLPQIIPGASGQGTESDGKVIYTAFGQLVDHEEKDWEEAIFMQLGKQIKIIRPESLLQDLRLDQSKDANQGLDAQGGMMQNGAGGQ